MTVFECVSIFISLVAVGFVIYQSKAVIKHNKLSIRPLIGFNVDTTQQNLLLVTMRNNGFGPAIIKKLLVFVDGVIVDGRKPIETAVNQALAENGVQYDYEYYHTIDETGLAALGKDVDKTLLKIVFHSKPSDSDIEALRKISVEIEYESLYGEKFSISTKHIKDWI